MEFESQFQFGRTSEWVDLKPHADEHVKVRLCLTSHIPKVPGVYHVPTPAGGEIERVSEVEGVLMVVAAGYAEGDRAGIESIKVWVKETPDPNDSLIWTNLQIYLVYEGESE